VMRPQSNLPAGRQGRGRGGCSPDLTRGQGDAIPGVEAGGLTVFQQDLVLLFRVLIMPSLP